MEMIASPQNRYEVIGTIGTGATSRVDKARDSMIGRTVALKTFLHSFGSGDLQKQFLREAQIIGRLSHPFIVGIYDVGVNPDGRPYLVLEYVEGKTLDATLDAGRLPLERAALWAADLASALSRAHQCKVIHGDVKPANVLITPEGQVKLGDFGIARFATQVSGSGRILGTPAYLSPEQILGHKQDSRSDLFSLGIMLYQMTTGVRPFDGSSVGAVCAQIVSTEPLPPSHHNPELPAEFDHVVMRCLAKNPSNRYATAEALGASLYPFVSSKPIAAAPLARSWWKHPMQAGDLRLAAGVLVGLAIFGSGARAVWHHGLHKSNNDVSRLHAPQGSANGVGTDPSAPSMSGSRPINSEPSAYVINIGNADLSSPYVSAEQHSASGNGEESEDARNNSLATGAYPDLAGPTSVDTFSSTPMVSNPFARPQCRRLILPRKPEQSPLFRMLPRRPRQPSLLFTSMWSRPSRTKHFPYSPATNCFSPRHYRPAMSATRCVSIAPLRRDSMHFASCSHVPMRACWWKRPIPRKFAPMPQISWAFTSCGTTNFSSSTRPRLK